MTKVRLRGAKGSDGSVVVERPRCAYEVRRGQAFLVVVVVIVVVERPRRAPTRCEGVRQFSSSSSSNAQGRLRGAKGIRRFSSSSNAQGRLRGAKGGQTVLVVVERPRGAYEVRRFGRKAAEGALRAPSQTVLDVVVENAQGAPTRCERGSDGSSTSSFNLPTLRGVSTTIVKTPKGAL